MKLYFIIVILCITVTSLGAMNISLNAQLFNAVQVQDLEKVKELIQAGGYVNQVNRWGDTPLYWAACRGHLETVKLLLAAGANVNQADSYGDTPLFQAAFYGYLDIVRELIQAEADVNQADSDGQAPLYKAARKGYLPVIQELIKAGANVNQADNYGYTPLIVAANEGHLLVVKELIKAGTIINQADLDAAANPAIKAILMQEVERRNFIKELEQANPLQALIIINMLNNPDKYKTQIEQLKQNPYLVPEEARERMVKAGILPE